MPDSCGVAIVGYGLAGKWFHAPLVRRAPGLRLHAVVARQPDSRALAARDEGVLAYPTLDQALADPEVGLVVVATPHDTHADLAVRALEAGRDCVVDKVMALTEADCDRMIAARDRSGKMLSVFHNRRWDWDFSILSTLLAEGRIGRPLLIESSVVRYGPPRTWRGRAESAGTILHDWGAHLVDQALMLGLGPCRRLTAWLTPAPWPGVDTGGHGRIVMEFDGVLFQAETSRVSHAEKPRWWAIGTEGSFVKHGVDPQEAALRAGDLDLAAEPEANVGILRRADAGRAGNVVVDSLRGPGWDAYYVNVADHLAGLAPLAVTAEQGREVVRVLAAAARSAASHQTVEGPWGAAAEEGLDGR